MSCIIGEFTNMFTISIFPSSALMHVMVAPVTRVEVTIGNMKGIMKTYSWLLITIMSVYG